MKKLFLSFVAAIVAATATYAQSIPVATLNHEGNLKVFSGSTGLIEAMKVAQDGDEIVLSSGSFTATDITKAVSIRGAGMEEDTIRRITPTFISKEFNIAIPETAKQRLTITGVFCEDEIHFKGTLKDAIFQKCRMKSLTTSYWAGAGSTSYGNVYNMMGVNCYVENLKANYTGSSYYITTIFQCIFINSVIVGEIEIDDSQSWLDFKNCIVRPKSSGSLVNSSFTNCIIYNAPSGSDIVLPSSCHAYRCVGYCGSLNNKIFYNMPSNTLNVNDDKIASKFKANTFYELTDEAAAMYLGTDGTQVGIYGGDMSWNTAVVAPRLTKLNVAKKSTSDGKLKVEVEVEAAE